MIARREHEAGAFEDVLRAHVRRRRQEFDAVLAPLGDEPRSRPRCKARLRTLARLANRSVVGEREVDAQRAPGYVKRSGEPLHAASFESAHFRGGAVPHVNVPATAEETRERRWIRANASRRIRS
jgi:hypothetical protein